MPRICGVDIPKEKRLEISLTYVHGIGRVRSNVIIKEVGLDPGTKAKDLSGEEVAKLTTYITKTYKVEGDLKREVNNNIKRLIEIGSYRGLRHKRGLPTRGQRTNTNARTRKGPKKTVGVQRKSSMQPKKGA